MTIDTQQVLFTLERMKAERQAFADKLHDDLDYNAEFPSNEAERLGEAIALVRQRDQLVAFARDILSHWPDGGDLDGGDIQDLAIKHGLLVGTVVHEPCNGGDPDKPCACAEFCNAAEFAEGVICYRTTDLLKGGAE